MIMSKHENKNRNWGKGQKRVERVKHVEWGCPNIIYNYWGNNATTRFDSLLFQLQQEISEYDLMMEVCEFAHGQ